MMMNRKNAHPISPLLWVMLFDHTSLNMTFPVLTLLFFDVQSSLFSGETSLSLRSMWYGLCVALPHIINIVMAPLFSFFSDHVGRKKILIVGTLGALFFALTAAFGVFFGILSLFFLARIVQGLFSRTNPVAQAVIGDVSPPEKKLRHMGYLQWSISMGAFIGPIIGGYFAKPFFFAQLNFSLPYFIAAIFAFVSCLLSVFFFKETVKPAVEKNTPRVMGRAMLKIMRQRAVWEISVILLLSQVSWSLYYQFMPPLLKTTAHFNPHALGLFVGLIAFWLAVATGIGIKLLDTFFSVRQMLHFSLYAVLAGLLCTVMAFWASIPLFIFG